MAVRRLPIIIVFLAAIIVIAALQYSAKKSAAQRSADDARFANTYVQLAVAGETYRNNPDSLEIALAGIFRANDCDSTWMYNHINSLVEDPQRYERIWNKIMAVLDSLENTSGDTTDQQW